MQYTQQQRLAPEVTDESALYSPISDSSHRYTRRADLLVNRIIIKANTDRRRDATRQLSRVGVSGVYLALRSLPASS